MRILFLKPKIAGYLAQLGSDVGIVPVSSGMPRRRRFQNGASHKVTVNFTLKAYEYDYLMAFWRMTRAEPFVCRLITDSSKLRWHECRWASTPVITNLGAKTYSFSCEVAVGKYVKMTRAKRASHTYPLDHHEVPVQVSAKPLRALLKQVVWPFNLIEALDVTATPLNAKLRALVTENAFTHGMSIDAAPLNGILTAVINDNRFNDAMSVSATPLNAKLMEVVHIRRIAEAVGVEAAPLNAKLIQWAWPKYVADGALITSKPLNAKLTDARILYTHPSEDAAAVSAKPLNARLY